MRPSPIVRGHTTRTDELRYAVEAGVLEEIDEAVKEKVAEEIPRLMPQHLQNEVASYRKQLQEVQRALHNSYVYSRFVAE